MPEQEADERRHNVNESHDKIRVTWKCNRGNDTRNQDTFTVKVRGDDPQEVAGELAALQDAIGTAQGGLMEAARDIQPEEN